MFNVYDGLWSLHNFQSWHSSIPLIFDFGMLILLESQESAALCLLYIEKGYVQWNTTDIAVFFNEQNYNGSQKRTTSKSNQFISLCTHYTSRKKKWKQILYLSINHNNAVLGSHRRFLITAHLLTSEWMS